MVVSGSLLETKFYVPRPRHSLVSRRRLNESLNGTTESKLRLLSAPAGFGKTTLLAEWLTATRADGRLEAWLAIDPADTTRRHSGPPLDWLWGPEITAELDSQVQGPVRGDTDPTTAAAAVVAVADELRASGRSYYP
jgi:hypothetical protein